MSLVAAALGTGKLPVPHFAENYTSRPKNLNFSKRDLSYVREGMRKVVSGGTGRRAGERVEADVMGKTGTAEVGSRANRRKNTWFIAYVTPTPKSLIQEPLALALVVENGDTGGSTSAPKVGEILRAYYGESEG
jgi:penicillin-binding protein 2